MPITIITGGTGLIGKSLTKYLVEKGHDIIIFSRNVDHVENAHVTFKKWDPATGEINLEAISTADYIVNLAGIGIMNKQWSSNYKKQIVESRIKGGELLTDSLKNIKNHVKVFISASAIGWYGQDKADLSQPTSFTESDPPSKDFLGKTCFLWEESVEEISRMDIRLIKLRFGIVLSNEGGAFPEFKKSLKYGIASILSNGKQIISWIHINDICRMISFIIQHDNLSGVYNAVAPEPVRNKEMVIETAKILRKNFFIPIHVPKQIINLFFGQRSVEILKSTKVSSKKIRSAGFTFLYPSLKLALDQLCNEKS